MATSVQGQWMVAGDFNDIVDSREKKGGGPLNTRKYHIFQARIQQCSFIDLGSVGSMLIRKGLFMVRTLEPLSVWIGVCEMLCGEFRFIVLLSRTSCGFLITSSNPYCFAWEQCD